MTKEFVVKLEKTIHEKDLLDVFCVAFEGGSNYWINDFEHEATVVDGGDAGRTYTGIKFVYDPEDYNQVEPKHNPVTADDLARAVQMILDGSATAPIAREQILNCLDELGMVDGDGADAILQVAAFDEVVYG